MFLPREQPSLNFNSIGESKADPRVPSPLVIPDDPPVVAPPVSDITIKQLEVTTMISIKTAISAILGAALLATPANADSKEEMTKAVEKLEAATKKLEAVEKSLTDYKLSNATAVRQLQADVEALKEDVKYLRQIIANPSTTSKRESFDTPRMGRVKLMNEFVEEMSVVVNGTSYRLLPGQTRTINVPPGMFTYQVLQLQRTVQERPIAADEEKPIRIFTQR